MARTTGQGPHHRPRLGARRRFEEEEGEEAAARRHAVPARARPGGVVLELPAGRERQLRASAGARRPCVRHGRPAGLWAERPPRRQPELHRLAGRRRAPARPGAEDAAATRSACGKARKYKRVALAGHSAAGEISILEAYSYKDVNALIVVGLLLLQPGRGQHRVREPAQRLPGGGHPTRDRGRAELRAVRPDAGRVRADHVPQRHEGGPGRGHPSAQPRPVRRQPVAHRRAQPAAGRRRARSRSRRS